MPHHVASDQGLQCLLTGLDTPKMTNRLVQHITVEESTGIQRVKKCHYNNNSYVISFEVHNRDIFILFTVVSAS